MRRLKSNITALKAPARMIKRNFHGIVVEDFGILYKTCQTSFMEYAIQAWSPHMVKDIQLLEKVVRN